MSTSIVDSASSGDQLQREHPAFVRPEASPIPVARPGVKDSRNFAHAFCDTCGWRGPGRRARSVAEEDGALHALAGCGL